MSRQKTKRVVRAGTLARPGELDAIILPARKAFDALTAEEGFDPEGSLSIAIFGSLCEMVAERLNKPMDAQAAMRMTASLTKLLEERAIDEEDLDQMKADFFRLVMMLRMCPAKLLWRLIDDLSNKE